MIRVNLVAEISNRPPRSVAFLSIYGLQRTTIRNFSKLDKFHSRIIDTFVVYGLASLVLIFISINFFKD